MRLKEVNHQKSSDSWWVKIFTCQHITWNNIKMARTESRRETGGRNGGLVCSEVDAPEAMGKNSLFPTLWKFRNTIISPPKNMADAP